MKLTLTKRKLKPLEIVLIAVVVAALVAVAYYFGVYRTTGERVANAQLELETMETQVVGLEARTNQMHKMQADIDSQRNADGALAIQAPKYDNFEFVMNHLNTLMSGVTNYSINFQPVAVENDLVRRVINISFSAPSYSNAKAIMKNLQNAMYRCKLDTLSISGSEGGINGGEVSASVSLTFYEWM